MSLSKAPLSIKAHLGETARLAWPVIIGQLGHIVIGNADTIMIGQLGSTELAAASLANGVFFLLLMIGIGVCIAVSPLTAQAIGAEKGDEALKDILQQSVLVALWLGLIFAGLLFALAEVLPYLGQEPAVAALAQDYLRILAISGIPMMLFLSYKHFIEGFEYVMPGMILMATMVLVNIFANWLLIYGNWGMPRLGLNGAGWATLLARTIGMVLMVAYILNSKRFRVYGKLKGFWIHKRKVIADILRLGIPTGMQYFFEVGAFTGAVILAGWIGKKCTERAPDRHSNGFHNLYVLPRPVFSSFDSGRQRTGRGDFQAVRRAGAAANLAGLICVVFFVSLLIGLRHYLPAYYIKDPEVIEITVSLLMIAAFFQLFDGMQAIILGALRGISDVMVPTAFTFIAYWVVGLPLAYVLAFPLEMGIQGIWYALTAGLAFSAAFMILRFERKSRPAALKDRTSGT